jgi:hydrogenase/urease accessory protein HupE
MPAPTRWLRVGWILVFALAMTRAEAGAHTLTDTSGPFFGGLKHFFVSLNDVLAAVGIGLVAGLRGSPIATRALLAFSGAWVVAGLGGIFSGVPEVTNPIPSGVALLLVGILAGLDRPFSSPLVVALAILMGGLHGLLNGFALHPAGLSSALFQLAGISIAAFFSVLYIISLLDLWNRAWIRIVARVLGSWIAASGLLLLGWSLRPAP